MKVCTCERLGHMSMLRGITISHMALLILVNSLGLGRLIAGCLLCPVNTGSIDPYTKVLKRRCNEYSVNNKGCEQQKIKI